MTMRLGRGWIEFVLIWITSSHGVFGFSDEVGRQVIFETLQEIMSKFGNIESVYQNLRENIPWALQFNQEFPSI